MKKYILGTLLIAAVLTTGGIKFFGDAKSASASIACGAGVNGIAVGQCYLGSLCVNTGQAAGTGVFVDPPNSCGSIAVGGSAGASLSGNTPTLSWTPSVGATYYIVQISD